jgi:predicted dehydrogenase
MVYLATPPFLHFPQAMKALAAGKHVLCEKPLAMDVAEAEAMIRSARARDLLLVANLMQRYNPLIDAVKEVVTSRLLGEFLHGSFENNASDENLNEEHWFWDRSKSGGIFIEHGVHFFDLFAGWFGPGTVECAQVGPRPGTDIEEHVACSTRFGDTALVHFYHGFHQAGRMDRQRMRLVFERGDITLHEWVPTRATIHALADEAQTRALCAIFPGARLDVTVGYGPKDRSCSGRGRSIDAYQQIELTHGEGRNKGHLYGELLRALMADQLAWVRDRGHVRKVTEQNGLDSLVMACEADRLAHLGR